MTMPASAAEPGRATAFAVYVLYLLSIPSLAIFALVGVIVALTGRDGAGPIARSHLDFQINIWMTAFWVTIGLALLAVIGAVLTIILIGFPILWIVGLLALALMIWFTVMSLLGLLALIDNRPR
ncbi:MAG TPA: hypothetical protein VFO00_10075 [Vitreimonas sp.]|nr:hypothetical protein [Vitreimonas sp.]